ncbi:MAG: GAF domain-containing protein [Myxococcota bacterium]
MADPAEVEQLNEALAREHRKLLALQDVGAALGSTLDLKELLALVLERVSEVMDADRSTLYLLDDEAGELWSTVAQGESEQEIRLALGEGLAGWVAQSGQALRVRDAYQDVRFDGEWDRKSGYRTRSTLCVPMKNQHGRTIGVIQALNKRSGEFTAEDEALLTALATQAAVSVENSKLFLSVVGKNIELLETKEQLERKVAELDVLFEIAQVSASATQLDDLLEGVLARAMRAIDAEAASILLTDESTGELRFRAAVGGESEAVKRVRVRPGQGICGWVAAEGRPQIVNRAEADPRHSRDISDCVGYHPKSILCVPLRWDEGVGALELLDKSQGRAEFTEDDLKLATVIAGHVSTAIDLARNRELQARRERLSTIGQFLSGVLHDFKTPLTVISGYVQELVEEPDPAERKRLGETVLRQVDFINTMTRETLAFARGDSQLWVRKVYLRTFFQELADQLEKELADRQVRLELDVRDRGVAHFDAPKIQRAVHNLARNAAEAMQGRGGTFRIKVDRRPADGAVVLELTDDGPGVPDEIAGQLFESFTTHGKAGGTGLGLAVVRKMVEDHGGSIDVRSQPGETTFTVVLPQPDGASREGAAQRSQPA